MSTEPGFTSRDAPHHAGQILLVLLLLFATAAGCDADPGTPPGEAIPDKPASLCGKSRMELRPLSLDRLLAELHHLEDSPAELQAEIDKLCMTLVDFHAGRDMIVAVNRLMEIGKPAIPWIIAAFGKCGDLDSMEGNVNACMVDDTLRQIVDPPPLPLRAEPLRPMARPSRSKIERTSKQWAVWWFAKGYRQE